MLKKSTNKYFISLIFVIFFECLNNIYLNYSNQLIKILSYSYIYISFFLILFKININNFSNVPKIIIFLFFLILIYGLFEIFLNIDDNWRYYANNFYLALFGNVRYAPIFLAPIFFLWVFRENSIHYFEKISFFTVLIGIFINTIFSFLEIKLILVLLFPTFYLLAGFNCRPKSQRLIIIISICISFFYFLAESYRSGAVRILLSLIPFLLIYFNYRKINKLFIIFFLFVPILIIFCAWNNYPLLFSEIQKLYLGSNYDPLYADTRTFLYNEFFDEFKNSNLKTILFGKGALGTYYSPYFEQIYNSRVFSYGGDFYIRSASEVGIIHLLLKGGFFYFFLIFLILSIVLIKGYRTANNKYIQYQIINLSIFFTYMTVENRPFFSLLYICFWIILGFCSSHKILNLSDEEIKKQIY